MNLKMKFLKPLMSSAIFLHCTICEMRLSKKKNRVYLAWEDLCYKCKRTPKMFLWQSAGTEMRFVAALTWQNCGYAGLTFSGEKIVL